MSSTESDRENVIIVMAGGSLPSDAQLPRRSASSFSQGMVIENATEQSLPPLTAQATNLFQSVVAFVGDGCALVDDTEYCQRLQTCRACDRRTGERCTACGCWIALKARGRAFACPLGRWR
jgi:hypothetical protein